MREDRQEDRQKSSDRKDVDRDTRERQKKKKEVSERHCITETHCVVTLKGSNTERKMQIPIETEV